MIRRALPLVVLGLLGPLTGCAGGSSSSEAVPPPTPVAPTSLSATPTRTPAPKPPPAPPLRACYRLSYDQAVAPTASRHPRPCTQPHTSLTFSIGRLGKGAGGRPLPVDSKAAQRQVATECPRRFAAFVGGTEEERHLSLLRTVWFTPTLHQGDKGARWFRCDVVSLARDDSLATLTGPLGVRLEGVLDRADLRDRFAICGTAQPGTS
ncbi:MAG: septum formation family protein, partial [Nocardioides sp.]